MAQLQFFAIVFLSIQLLSLVSMLPRRAAHDAIFSRTRWLLAGATAMLIVQFVLQYTFKLRAMGVTQAVMFNLFLFVPASWLYNVAILYLQRQGRLKRLEWVMGLLMTILVSLVILLANVMDGEPLLTDTSELRRAEAVGAFLFSIMQIYYFVLQIRQLRIMHRSLDNYYDHDAGGMLRWMERSGFIITTMTLVAPVIIFGGGWVSALYVISLFAGIHYLIISFMCYVVSNDPRRMQEAAEVNNRGDVAEGVVEEAPALSDDDRSRVERAVKRWMANGSHLQSGITIQTAADDMKIPRYLFSAWLRTTPQELFSPWLAYWRIDEAKRLLIAHPDWSNDIIAQRCGFNTRNYFQTVFRKQTGMTPAQFIEQNK